MSDNRQSLSDLAELTRPSPRPRPPPRRPQPRLAVRRSPAAEARRLSERSEPARSPSDGSEAAAAAR